VEGVSRPYSRNKWGCRDYYGKTFPHVKLEGFRRLVIVLWEVPVDAYCADEGATIWMRVWDFEKKPSQAEENGKGTSQRKERDPRVALKAYR